MENIVFETSLGEVEIELYYHHAPKTCNNFSQLAKIGTYQVKVAMVLISDVNMNYIFEGYYNDTIFHRVIKDFVSH